MSDIDNRIPSMGPGRRKDINDVEEDPDNDGLSAESGLAMPPQMVVAVGDESNDDDSDDDNDADEGAGPGGDGYMLLPDADHDIDQAEVEAMDPEGLATAPSSQQQQQQQQPELPVHLAKLLPTQPPTQDSATLVSFADTPKTLEDRRQVMATDDEIQKAMAGFSLSGTAVPPWAMALGDNEWKDQLAEMIQGREEKRHETGRTSKDGKT